MRKIIGCNLKMGDIFNKDTKHFSLLIFIVSKGEM